MAGTAKENNFAAPILKIEGLNFAYPQANKPALADINLEIGRGEFVVLCGVSGSGKSTLLRHLKPALTPFGTKKGQICFLEEPLAELEPKKAAGEIGFVMQNPQNQLVTDKVWHELAFALENLGYDNAFIRGRVAEVAAFFGMQVWFHKSLFELSGGEKQLVNLAATMVLEPQLLLLDEPTGQLDPIAAADFLSMLQKINEEMGTTIILSEQRLEAVLPMASRVVVLADGKILTEGTTRQIGKNLQKAKHPMFLAMPTPLKIFASLEDKLPKKDQKAPITVGEGRAWLAQVVSDKTKISDITLGDNAPVEPCGSAILQVKDVWFKYDAKQPPVLQNLSFAAREGELVALVGPNGSGKSTLLGVLACILRPQSGRVWLAPGKKLALLPQDPTVIFTKSSVEEELLAALNNTGGLWQDSQQKNKLAWVAQLCHLTHLFSRHPYDLSGGEQGRLALAKLLLLEPDILLLDEPTKGLDALFKQELAGILKELQKTGHTIILVSHDIEFCALYADRCGFVFDGVIISQGSPQEFFAGKSFYTTAASRMARQWLPNAVTAEAVIKSLGGESFFAVMPNDPPPKQQDPPNDFWPDLQSLNDPTQNKAPNNKGVWGALLVLLVAMPLTIYFGLHLGGERKYLLTSFLLLLEIILPFALAFEAKHPKAREIVLLSVLCALAVVGRLAFFMLPQFKPTLAVVIITGLCLGPQSGFLVGALVAFVSNMFFGQGPWTLWQMLAFGLVGFLAGLFFQKGRLPQKRGLVVAFGFFAALIIYGGIMNPASVLMFQPQPTWQMFVLSYAQGFPFDLVHALATGFFLFLLALPIQKKIARAQLKHGWQK